MSIQLAKMKTKRLRLTVRQRLDILEEYEAGADVNMLAVKYGTDDLGIMSIWDARERLKKFASNYVDYAVRVNMKRPKFEELDYALHEWFQSQRESGVHITNKMLRKKALALHKSLYSKNGEKAYFIASMCWIKNFKRRFGIPNLTPQIKLCSRNDIALDEDTVTTQNINTEEFGKLSWDLDVNEIDVNLMEINTTPEPATPKLKTYSRPQKKVRTYYNLKHEMLNATIRCICYETV